MTYTANRVTHIREATTSVKKNWKKKSFVDQLRFWLLLSSPGGGAWMRLLSSSKASMLSVSKPPAN